MLGWQPDANYDSSAYIPDLTLLIKFLILDPAQPSDHLDLLAEPDTSSLLPSYSCTRFGPETEILICDIVLDIQKLVYRNQLCYENLENSTNT